MRDPAIRYTTQRRVFYTIAALMLAVLCSVSGSVAMPRASYAAPPAQTPDMCTLLASGALKVTPIMRGCESKYGTGKFKGVSQPQEIQATADVFQDVSVASAQHMADCANVSNDPMASKKCTQTNVGEKGYEILYDPPAPKYFGRAARGCYFAEVWLETSTDTWGRTVDQDLVNRGREILRQIDEKLRAAPACAGATTAVPARLNVGIGGTYDEANDRVTVTAGVENRPNVGVGDDYYEWTLDGTPIQKGKELKSIEYDTSSLSAGEHEIVAKVTDIINNVSGGATYKFTKTKPGAGVQPPKPSSPAQVQITTPSGTQTVNSGTKTPVTLSSGKAQIQAKCDAAVYGLLTYLVYKEGDDPDAQMFRGRALALAILVQAYCDKLLAAHSMASSELARPLALQTPQDMGAAIEMDVQDGAGQFEISNSKTAVRFLTANAQADAYGQQSLIVGYDPATQTTLVRMLNGSVNVSPKNNSLAPVTLQAGQSVLVTADKFGNVQQTQNAPSDSSVPGTTLSMPPFGSTEPYPAVNGRTIQIAQRHVPVGDSVLIPVWLMNANDVANINAQMTFDSNIARPEGTITKGYLLDTALFSANPKDSGIVRIAFAQPTNLANGTGPMAYFPFRAVGKPGDRTKLTAHVTAINNQDGGAQSIDRINGEIVILNKDGTLPGGSGTDFLPPGACSGNKQLTELDALCALEISVGLRPATQIMDMDGSGAIDSRDVVLILKQVIGGK